MASVCPPGRRRFHAIDAIACPQRRYAGADCRNRAGIIVAQNQRKPGRAEQGEQASAIALTPSHIDWIDGGRFHRDFDFIRARLLSRELVDLQCASAVRPET